MIAKQREANWELAKSRPVARSGRVREIREVLRDVLANYALTGAGAAECEAVAAAAPSAEIRA